MAIDTTPLTATWAGLRALTGPKSIQWVRSASVATAALSSRRQSIVCNNTSPPNGMGTAKSSLAPKLHRECWIPSNAAMMLLYVPNYDATKQ